MRIFVGGTNGLVLFEEGETTKLWQRNTLTIAKVSGGRIVAGTDQGHVVAYDGSDARVVAKDLGDQVHCITGASDGAIYAGVFPAGVLVSKDGGETFKDLASVADAPNRETWTAPWGTPLVSSIAVHPKDPKTVFMGVEVGGVYRSRDRGKRWFDLEVPHPDVHCIEISPAKHDRVFVTTGAGPFCTDDEGFTWKPMGQNNPRKYTMGLSAHPVEADRVIISAASGNPPWSGRSAVCDVYLSTDSGRRFRTVAKNLKGGVRRKALTINPKVPSEVAFGTSTGELYYSNDGGESFDRVGAKLGDIEAVVFA